MSLSEEIRTRLEEAFSPRQLEVIDDSESHRGHGGYQEGGESHWHLVIASVHFKGMSRIARQRAVHAAIGPEIIWRIHALSMELSD